MEELRHLDEVGYVRFASVYRSFQDFDAFAPKSIICGTIAGAASPARTSCRCCPASAPTTTEKEMTAETSAAAIELHLARALRLAARGLYTTDPNPRVGCVMVKDGKVIGEGWHERAGEAHAEVLALAHGGWRGARRHGVCELEPCSHTGRTPPCADALIAAGSGAWCAAHAGSEPAGGGRWDRRGCRAAGIEVTVGAMADEARRPQHRFFLAPRAWHGRSCG